jgi:hypothetical protein
MYPFAAAGHHAGVGAYPATPRAGGRPEQKRDNPLPADYIKYDYNNKTYYGPPPVADGASPASKFQYYAQWTRSIENGGGGWGTKLSALVSLFPEGEAKLREAQGKTRDFLDHEGPIDLTGPAVILVAGSRFESRPTRLYRVPRKRNKTGRRRASLFRPCRFTALFCRPV